MNSSICFRRCAVQGALAAFLLIPGILPAAESNSPAAPAVPALTNLTVDQAVAEALARNPQLESLRARLEAMKQRSAQAGALPDPTIKYSGMDAADGGNFPDTNEKRLMVEQAFPWFGKRDLRSGEAEKDAETMQQDYGAASLDVVMRVKETCYDLHAVQRSEAITRSEADVLGQMEETARSQYGTGKADLQDVTAAQAEVTMLRPRLLELGSRETTLKAKLNMLLNRRADAPVGVTIADPPPPLTAGAAQLSALAKEHRPEIKGAQAQVDKNQYAHRLMAKESYPDYALGLEYRSLRDSDDLVMFTAAVSLPIWRSKYSAGVREAEQMVESSKAMRESTEREVSFDVQDAYAKAVTAAQTEDLYAKTLIPQAQARFTAAAAGYRAGKADFLTVLESERFLLNARGMQATAEGDLCMAWARLERAVGLDWRSIQESEGTKQ